MSHKKLARQIERRRERRQSTNEKERQERTARERWFGSDASYRQYKAISEDATVADNEKFAVFQAEMYRQKPKAERSFMDSVYIWMVDHRKTAVFKGFASLCGFAYNVPDKKPYMIALRIASYIIVALCALAAVKTGQHGTYFCYAVVVLGLSYYCTKSPRPKPGNADVGEPSGRFVDTISINEEANP